MAASEEDPTAATAYRSSPPTAHHWAASPHVYPHSHHGTPAQEYTGFSFHHSPQLEMEPSAFSSSFSHRPAQQQLQPLIMPQMPQWPSMISSHSQPSYQQVYQSQPQTISHHQHPTIQPIQPAQPAQSSGAASLPTPVSATRSTSTPRRTLTDGDRKAMCQYAEDHPNSKQTEIGAIFGVERSTVSKVLRQKEKYLLQEDGSRSPVKRIKGRSPDIDKTLAKWAVKQERLGQPLTDDLIREKARYFAAATTSPENPLTLSTSWLEKFKLKHNLMGARSRKASLAANDSERTSQAHEDISPLSSPRMKRSPSPTDLAGHNGQEHMKNESPDSYGGFRHPFHSASTTSVSTAFTDGAPLSPTSPFFTPDSATAPSPFMPIPVSRPLQSAAAPAGSIRPRSQTFPLLDQYVLSAPDSLAPKFVESSSVLDSPMEELHDPMARIDETMTAMGPNPVAQQQSHLQPSPDDRRDTVAPSDTMGPPPLPAHLATHNDLQREKTPLTSPEEACRAFEVVLGFFQQQPSGFLDLQESLTMGKLMEKLKLKHRDSIGE